MSAPALKADGRPRPYRRFLTSAFHSRFGYASLAALLLALDNVWWTAWSSGTIGFWSWFPIGPAFPKIILFYFSSMAVFILRLATLNIGRVTTASPLATSHLYILSLSTIQIFFWYLFSAWWFCEIYIWSAPDLARLGWVSRGDMSTPDRLNERPIYLRAILFSMALIQSLRYIYFNHSCLHIPASPPPEPSATDKRTHRVDGATASVRNAIIPIIGNSIAICVPTALLGPFYYTLFLRQTFWWLHLQLAKPFFNLSRSNARPTGYPPSNPFLMLRSFLALFLSVVTWDATSLLFSTYLAQEPLKKNQPLSAGSKDPNGTLLHGLRSKRNVVKTFAFWELAIIAQRYPDRRRAIFADIERPDGARWDKMLESALEVIRDITNRISPTFAPSSTAETLNNTPATKTVGLLRLLPEVSSRSVFMESPRPRRKGKQVEALVGTGMRRLGQSPKPWSLSVHKVEGLLEYMRPPGATSMGPSNIFQQWWTFLQTGPIGWFFKTTPERQVNALVLGSPYGNAALIVDAIEAVTKMLVASLSEDMYGRAMPGVPGAVRTFTAAINAIEELIRQHAIDGHVAGDIGEVEIVLDWMKAGLRELMLAFQVYLRDAGMGLAECNRAEEAALPRHRRPTEAAREQIGQKPVDLPPTLGRTRRPQPTAESTSSLPVAEEEAPKTRRSGKQPVRPSQPPPESRRLEPDAVRSPPAEQPAISNSPLEHIETPSQGGKRLWYEAHDQREAEIAAANAGTHPDAEYERPRRTRRNPFASGTAREMEQVR